MVQSASPRSGRITWGKLIIYALLAAGAIGAACRFIWGLGGATHLSDGYPWGLWIGFDVMSGVALAAGGFTLSATIYVFNLKRFEPLLRPAKLSAFVGYLMVVVGILFDVGSPGRIWHPLIMWNTQSPLFEVAWCVMLYTTVLSIEVLILAMEALNRERWVKALRSAYIVLIVAGIILSTLHQSSLGAIFLLLPEKMSDLWASNALGPLFYVSAVIAGLSVVILESLLSAKAHGRKPQMDLLSSLSNGLAIALLIYLAMKVTDLYARRVSVWQADNTHLLFFVELFGTIVLPAALLGFFPDVRKTPAGLMWCAGLAAFGVVLNRLNISITAYAGYRSFRYFPSVAELAVTAGLVALGILLFDLGARHLPVYGKALGRVVGPTASQGPSG